MYPGLGPPQGTQGPHHLSQFVQPHPYPVQVGTTQSGQQAAMMHRQLGQSHLGTAAVSSAGGGSGVVPHRAGAERGRSGPGNMLPPGNNMRHQQLQEKRNRDAELRRKAQEKRQREEEEQKNFLNSDIFSAPVKISNSDDQVNALTYLCPSGPQICPICPF